jgi:hypothetical protein
MSVREDLIAAKALIDTPEKFGAMEFGVLGALSDSLPEEEGVTDADLRFNAMRNALLVQRTGTLMGLNRQGHADIMALFDAAIAAAGDA